MPETTEQTHQRRRRERNSRERRKQEERSEKINTTYLFENLQPARLGTNELLLQQLTNASTLREKIDAFWSMDSNTVVHGN